MGGNLFAESPCFKIYARLNSHFFRVYEDSSKFSFLSFFDCIHVG